MKPGWSWLDEPKDEENRPEQLTEGELKEVINDANRTEEKSPPE